MGSNKHKHKSKKRKHNRSSESSEREYEKERRHHKKHSKDKKEKRSKPILVDEYDSSNSDDVIIVTPPPPPKISRPVSPSPPPKKIAKLSHVSPPPPPVIRRRKSPTPPPVIRRRKSPTPPPVTRRRKSPTPPPVIRRRKSPTPPPAPSVSRENKATTNSSSDASLSIEETNKLRLKLGLKPLDVNSAKPKENDKEKKETFGGIDMGDFVHKPPENISTKTYNEKLKEKLTLKREKRLLEEKLANVKKLAEGSDSDDDVSKWVEKNRKVINEKEQAEKRAKELDALDEVFGIGELIEEDMKSRKKYAYTAKDLKGLKVEHSSDKFVEGREIVLTLKDKGVLEEEDDTLVNVNILDEERYKKNIDRRKQKPGYNAYDDSADLEEEIFDKKVLSKYDEEIDGEKKSSFTLGVSSKTVEEARREAIRQKLQQQHVGKRLETLAMALTPASEYFTEQEIETKFKKIKKKVRKIRKRKVLKADDLLRDDYATKDEPIEDPALRGIGKRRNNSSRVKVKEEVKEEPMDEDLDVDDLPPPLPIDTSNIKVEVDDEDDKDLQLALHRSRKLQQIETLQSNNSADINDVSMEDASGNAAGGSIVLNATAEFCRTLGDIPTYGQAGNREEEAQELLDFEKELKEEKMRKEEIDSLTTGWNEVATADVPPVDIVTPTEVPILDAEPDISTGVAGALKMAICKGYVQNETEKRPSASRFAHLQAQNYSIEDKAYTMEDDKHARRERYNGPTSDFKEKEGYKPNVKLEYIDDDGHILSAKEAFRYLSHKFHGKGPGKNKIEKRMKKTEQEALMKQMSSTDTPLGTLNMLQQKQKETQSPFVVLSGSKHGHSTAIAKLKM